MPVWDRYLVAAALMLGLTTAAPMAQTSDLVSKTALRVCADPANFPMSSKDGSGYENKLAELVAAKLELPVEYTWYPMATGFIRNTLRAKNAMWLSAYAQGHELVLNTNHYFTSAYTLIVRKGWRSGSGADTGRPGPGRTPDRHRCRDAAGGAYGAQRSDRRGSKL